MTLTFMTLPSKKNLSIAAVAALAYAHPDKALLVAGYVTTWVALVALIAVLTTPERWQYKSLVAFLAFSAATNIIAAWTPGLWNDPSTAVAVESTNCVLGILVALELVRRAFGRMRAAMAKQDLGHYADDARTHTGIQAALVSWAVFVFGFVSLMLPYGPRYGFRGLVVADMCALAVLTVVRSDVLASCQQFPIATHVERTASQALMYIFGAQAAYLASWELEDMRWGQWAGWFSCFVYCWAVAAIAISARHPDRPTGSLEPALP